MVYVTVKQSPRYKQISLDEFLYSSFKDEHMVSYVNASTRTYELSYISERFASSVYVPRLVRILKEFNDRTEYLRNDDIASHYTTFYIPKKSGGLRRIDAPNTDLMDELRRLKTIFENDFKALYHTSAFAYVKKRSTIDAVKRHQKNESKWFGKYDLSNFFGNTTPEFVMKQLAMVFPFSEVIKSSDGKSELEKALSLAFLNGGLPQGTPLSPLLTNIIMIPIDYKLSKLFRDFDKQRFVYTRYADDFLISSRYDFDCKKVEAAIVSVLSEFGAPFSINEGKTRYGSSAGRNWNLGVMLNKDNKITVGHKNINRFRSMIYNYGRDKKNGINWDNHDVLVMNGTYSYYRMVEAETIDSIVSYVNKQLDVNILELIKADLKA